MTTHPLSKEQQAEVDKVKHSLSPKAQQELNALKSKVQKDLDANKDLQNAFHNMTLDASSLKNFITGNTKNAVAKDFQIVAGITADVVTKDAKTIITPDVEKELKAADAKLKAEGIPAQFDPMALASQLNQFRANASKGSKLPDHN